MLRLNIITEVKSLIHANEKINNECINFINEMNKLQVISIFILSSNLNGNTTLIHAFYEHTDNVFKQWSLGEQFLLLALFGDEVSLLSDNWQNRHSLSPQDALAQIFHNL
jgi:hypothetical protein